MAFVQPSWLFKRGRHLWGWGEATRRPNGARALPAVWTSWQRSMRVWPLCPAPIASVLGPAYSGKHRVAKGLLTQALAARHSCFWLGAYPPWQLPPASLGQLYYGQACDNAAAARMLEIVLGAQAADVVIWVVQAPLCPRWLVAQWPQWSAQAQTAGCCVLLVAPASHAVQRVIGPAWHLSEGPWTLLHALAHGD